MPFKEFNPFGVTQNDPGASAKASGFSEFNPFAPEKKNDPSALEQFGSEAKRQGLRAVKTAVAGPLSLVDLVKLLAAP